MAGEPQHGSGNMSDRDVNAFLDRLDRNEEFWRETKTSLAGQTDVAAATVEFAKQAGYEFSVAEFHVALESRYADRELSDEQLESVAGGMFPVVTTGGGVCIAFPDVCKTPSPGGPVPVPYPNIGTDSGGTKTTSKTKF